MSNLDPVTPLVRKLFVEAKNLPPENQAEFLARKCGEDTTLQRAVSRLLEASESSSAEKLDKAIEAFSDAKLEVSAKTFIEEAVTAYAHATFPDIDGFEIEEALGAGGMGIVFRARQLQPLVRTVAIKVIKPGMDSVQVLRRFRGEQQALALMSHPNISQVYEAGMTLRGHPYFAMELTEGLAIDRYCEQHRVSLREKLNFFLDVLAAVSHAHERGVIHRDLKPSNVLICQTANAPVVKVIDFGVAKALAQETENATEFTKFAQLVGTPLYMSPEQTGQTGCSLDQRSDVYALGGLLYKLLSGFTPLDSSDLRKKSVDQIRTIICKEVPSKPSSRCPSGAVAKELDWIVLKAIEKAPSRRYQSAKSFADDIQRFLEHRPVLARRSSLRYRSQKLLTRYGSRVSKIAILVGLGSVLGLTLAMWKQWTPDGSHISIAPTSPLGVGREVYSNEDLPEATLRLIRDARDQSEASALVRMLDALDKGRLDSLADYPLPRDTDGRFPGAGDSKVVDSALVPSLRQLLTNLGSPTPLRTFAHPEAVSDISISPDQRLLASACKDNFVWIWDLESGEHLGRLGPHQHDVTAVLFSPDGSQIVTGDRHGIVSFWNVAAQSLEKNSGKRDGGIESLAYSPDGQRIVAGVRYDHVAVFDARGNELFKIHNNEQKHPRYEAIRFENDSGHLVVANCAGGLEVWDLYERKLVSSIPVSGAQNPIRGFDFIDPNYDYLLSGQKDSISLHVTDIHTQENVNTVTAGLDLPFEISNSPDGSRIAIAYSNGRLLIVPTRAILQKNADTIERSEQVMVRLHSPLREITSARWLNSAQLLTSAEDGMVHQWEVSDLVPFKQRSVANGFGAVFAGGKVACIKRDPALRGAWIDIYQDAVANKSPNGSAGKHAAVSIQVLDAMTEGPVLDVNRFAMHSPTHRLAVAVSDGVDIYDTLTGEMLMNIQEQEIEDAASESSQVRTTNSISWSPAGTKLAVCRCDRDNNRGSGVLSIFQVGRDGKSHKLLRRCEAGKFYRVHILDNVTRFWAIVRNDSQEFHYETRLYDGESSEFTSLLKLPEFIDSALSSNARLLAISSRNTVLVINAKTGKRIDSIDTNMASDLVFTDEERILLYRYMEKYVLAYHLPTQEHLGSINLSGHAQLLFFCAEPDPISGCRLFGSWYDPANQSRGVSTLGNTKIGFNLVESVNDSPLNAWSRKGFLKVRDVRPAANAGVLSARGSEPILSIVGTSLEIECPPDCHDLIVGFEMPESFLDQPDVMVGAKGLEVLRGTVKVVAAARDSDSQQYRDQSSGLELDVGFSDAGWQESKLTSCHPQQAFGLSLTPGSRAKVKWLGVRKQP